MILLEQMSGFELRMVQRPPLVQKNQKLQYTFFKKVNNFIWIAGMGSYSWQLYPRKLKVCTRW